MLSYYKCGDFATAIDKTERGTDMKLIPYFDYDFSGRDNALPALHELATVSTDVIVCRVRQSKDGIPFICRESTLARLCMCEEQVSDLRFSEIDALFRLCNMRVITLDDLFSSYMQETPLVLHFRGFRPDGNTISRVVRDSRFSFATDSAEQLDVISMGYPGHRTVGFASHLRAAELMMQAGASVLCLYGREPAAYTEEQLQPLKARCELWTEIPSFAETGLDTMKKDAEALGFGGIVLSLDLIR